ncbi:hypothetical protein CPS_2721 [Colwellia psychrerythraea 34H]|uniref:Uncharacterized protein n=1 Tax=Colwellia psychrerythraea (strain 34H / ATCC BAA-681) TaxID=167879 RepID=Q480T6_COLP3|nr:hypothetical protein CPS_2721 [Colwellia psychrerythraea 34H]
MFNNKVNLFRSSILNQINLMMLMGIEQVPKGRV